MVFDSVVFITTKSLEDLMTGFHLNSLCLIGLISLLPYIILKKILKK